MSVFRFDERTIAFGLFCGIGICFDCLVIVDGKPNRRACLELAADGMQVRTQEGTGHGELAV